MSDTIVRYFVIYTELPLKEELTLNSDIEKILNGKQFIYSLDLDIIKKLCLARNKDSFNLVVCTYDLNKKENKVIDHYYYNLIMLESLHEDYFIDKTKNLKSIQQLGDLVDWY